MNLKPPMAEVFGFPVENCSKTAKRYRRLKLCPYNNKVPNCTKDKAENPLGVCSVFDNDKVVITCPVRFRQEWIIAEDAASFFFPKESNWTSLIEVKLLDGNSKSAGNIDVVLASYDANGKIIDFGSLEIQAVYISGNVRKPFEHFMSDPDQGETMDWKGKKNYPNPDFLSSSRKRLAPQLMFKGEILHAWKKKMAVALDEHFFSTLPELKEVNCEEAEVAWLIYGMDFDESLQQFILTQRKTVYTTFHETLDQITRPVVGNVENFIEHLQAKLDKKLTAPDAVPLSVDDL